MGAFVAVASFTGVTVGFGRREGGSMDVAELVNAEMMLGRGRRDCAGIESCIPGKVLSAMTEGVLREFSTIHRIHDLLPRVRLTHHRHPRWNKGSIHSDASNVRGEEAISGHDIVHVAQLSARLREAGHVRSGVSRHRIG